MLKETDFLAQLRKHHDVSVFQFNDDLKTDRAVTLNKHVESAANEARRQIQSPNESKPIRPISRLSRTKRSLDWEKILAPSGTETRLGQALRDLIQKERGSPLSGVVVLSDGGQNAGISPEAAMELAREAKMPIFTVGLGSDKQPKNVPRKRSDCARPGVSGRPLQCNRFSSGSAHGRRGGYSASSLSFSRSTAAEEGHGQGARYPASHPRRRR